MSKFILCFVFDGDGGYRPIPYTAMMQDGVRALQYADRYFLPLHGYLLEVSQADYIEFYRDMHRQQYIDKRSKDKQDFYYHALDLEGIQGESIIRDLCANVEEQAIRNIMADKLHIALQLLSDDEQRLVQMLYFEQQTQAHCAKAYGVSQQVISYRKKQIVERLRKIFEI